MIKTPCNHKFCKPCLVNLCQSKKNNARCPICRRDIVTFCGGKEINPLPEVQTQRHTVYSDSDVEELFTNNMVNEGDIIDLISDNQQGYKRWEVRRKRDGTLKPKLTDVYDFHFSSSDSDNDSEDESRYAGKNLPIRRKKSTKKIYRKKRTRRGNKQRHLKKQTIIKTSKKKRRITYRKQ
tara:strand:- start:27 stop:566 length:540 start_codon:yes stop_codon:yes gene_type:complete